MKPYICNIEAKSMGAEKFAFKKHAATTIAPFLLRGKAAATWGLICCLPSKQYDNQFCEGNIGSFVSPSGT